MADCTELAAVITELARDLVAIRPDIKTVDDVLFELQKDFPILSRESLIENLIDATRREQRPASEAKKRWAAILREGKLDVSLKTDKAQITEYLEKGTLPERTTTEPKEQSLAIQELRRSRDNMQKWLNTSDPAMKRQMQERLDALNDRIARGEIVVTTETKGQLHDVLKALDEQIKATQKKVATDKAVQKLLDQIDSLTKHLEEGTLPEKKPKPAGQTVENDVLGSLRNVRNDLQKKLAKSDQAKVARIKEHIANIDEIIKSIEDKTYVPPTEPVPGPMSKERALAQVDLDMAKGRLRTALDKLTPKPIWKRYNPLYIFHDVMFGGEFSYILRQGGASVYGALGKTIERLATARPTTKPLAELGSRLSRTFDALKDAAKADQVMKEQLADPFVAYMIVKGKLHISPWSDTVALSSREEFSLSDLGFKIPVWRGINRAGAVWLNLCRIDMCRTMSETLAINAEPTIAEAVVIANAANQATGRGYEGGGSIGDAARLFVSAQYVSSRFKLLTLQPIFGNLQYSVPGVRRAVAREYARVLLGLGALYVLAELAGAEIEYDPRSSDFLKWRFGNSRVDPLMGLQQFIVLAARQITNKKKLLGSGDLVPIRGPKVPFGGATGRDLLEVFVESKFAPVPSAVMNVLGGKKVTGEPTSLGKEALGMTHPITYGDLYNVMQEDGVAKDLALSVLAVFGYGLQTFQPRRQSSQRRYQ